MRKSILFVVLYLSVVNAFAQSYDAKNLLGWWQYNNKDFKDYFVFLSDSKAAYASADGRVHEYIKYTTELKNGIVKIKYIDDFEAKSPDKHMVYIKFLNDSTILYDKYGSMPAKADSATKHIAVYHKLKRGQPHPELRLSDYHDLVGYWVDVFDKKISKNFITFADSNHVIRHEGGRIDRMAYTIDFSKQPALIDLFNGKTATAEQGIIGFVNETTIRIEMFPLNKPRDHFTPFGQNRWYRRDTTDRK